MTRHEAGRLLAYIADEDYKVFIHTYSTEREYLGDDAEYLESIDKSEIHVYREINNWRLVL